VSEKPARKVFYQTPSEMRCAECGMMMMVVYPSDEGLDVVLAQHGKNSCELAETFWKFQLLPVTGIEIERWKFK